MLLQPDYVGYAVVDTTAGMLMYRRIGVYGVPGILRVWSALWPWLDSLDITATCGITCHKCSGTAAGGCGV